jgi:hypothetical protein
MIMIDAAGVIVVDGEPGSHSAVGGFTVTIATFAVIRHLLGKGGAAREQGCGINLLDWFPLPIV